MVKIGQDFILKQRLNFNQGLRVSLTPFVPKGEASDYSNRTKHGLGYILPEADSQIALASDDFLSSSSNTSDQDNDVRVGTMFAEHTINMISYSLIMDEDKSEVFKDPENDPQAKHLGAQWESHFEPSEQPTEDKVVQVNVGDETKPKPKPIFISESMSLIDKEELISLIREYIDVFGWVMKICLGWIRRQLCITSISIRVSNQSNNSKGTFVLN